MGSSIALHQRPCKHTIATTHAIATTAAIASTPAIATTRVDRSGGLRAPGEVCEAAMSAGLRLELTHDWPRLA